SRGARARPGGRTQARGRRAAHQPGRVALGIRRLEGHARGQRRGGPDGTRGRAGPGRRGGDHEPGARRCHDGAPAERRAPGAGRDPAHARAPAGPRDLGLAGPGRSVPVRRAPAGSRANGAPRPGARPRVAALQRAVAGRFTEGIGAGEKCLARLLALPAPPDRAAAATELGQVAIESGADRQPAVGKWLEEAVAAYERLGDRRGRERALTLLVTWLRR